MTTTSTDTRAFVGTSPWRTCDVTAYPLEQGGVRHDEAVRRHGADRVIYRVGAGWTTAEMAREMRAQAARRVEAAPPADGTEAMCGGCGRTVTFSCPPYVPVRFGEWVDADVVDVDINGHGETGRTCPDGNDHRPAVASAVAS